MKHFLLVTFCLLSLLHPSTAKPPISDSLLGKAAPGSLTQSLRKNNKNAEVLVRLIRQSIESKQTEVAFQTLDVMRQQEPDNAVVLAAYAMAYDASLYQVRKRTGIIRERTAKETKAAEEALQRAKKLSPTLWLPYTIEGFRLGYSPPWDYNRSLDLLSKSVNLSPRAFFARKQYASILDLAANNKGKWNGKVVTHQQAAAQYEIALKLEPSSADVAFALFSIYDVDLKDKAKAAKAKRAFLKALPPSYKIRKSVRERLALYPG